MGFMNRPYVSNTRHNDNSYVDMTFKSISRGTQGNPAWNIILLINRLTGILEILIAFELVELEKYLKIDLSNQLIWLCMFHVLFIGTTLLESIVNGRYGFVYPVVIDDDTWLPKLRLSVITILFEYDIIDKVYSKFIKDMYDGSTVKLDNNKVNVPDYMNGKIKVKWVKPWNPHDYFEVDPETNKFVVLKFDCRDYHIKRGYDISIIPISDDNTYG
jgi:hypothetical protein